MQFIRVAPATFSLSTNTSMTTHVCNFIKPSGNNNLYLAMKYMI